MGFRGFWEVKASRFRDIGTGRWWKIIQRKENRELRAVSRLCELYNGIFLTTEEKIGKTPVRVAQYKNNKQQQEQ
jgi:hypothetical protein